MADFKNPFDPDNFSLGIGWDGKLVTITGSKFETDLFGTDDNPWIDPNTGERGFANVWSVSGVTEDSDTERTEKYSIGKTLIPSNGGNSFEHNSGKPNATFNANSKAAKFARHLKDSGFDLSKLVDDEGLPNASGLIGAMFTFKGEQPIDYKTKQPAVDKNGYARIDYWPMKFEGFSKSAPAAASASSELTNRAYDLVTQLIEQADGKKLTRVQLIQGLNKSLAGDPDLNAIVTLAVSEKFNSAAPWKLEGNSISL